MKVALTLVASGLHPTAPPSVLLVDDKYFITDGWRSPCYLNRDDGELYDIGGAVPAAPATVDVAGATFPALTVLVYRFTHYDPYLDAETAPVEYEHTVGGAPANVQHTFADPSVANPQFTKVRLYRQVPSGPFHLVATIDANASPYVDTMTDATLENQLPMVQRYRITDLPKFRGWIFAQGRIIGWTGLDSILHFSQLRRVSVLVPGNVLTDFPDDAILPVDPNDGFGPIVRVLWDGEALMVFKEQAVYRIYGGPDPIDMDIEIVSAEVGALGQWGVLPVKSFTFFASDLGGMMLPPGGTPQILAQLSDVGVSPLEPIWGRVNRRALPLLRAWHDVRRGRYMVRAPLDDDPISSCTIVLEYRTPGERYVAVDEEVFFNVAGKVNDGGGRPHVLALDDLGQVIEMEQGDNDLLEDVNTPREATVVDTTEGMNVLTGTAWSGAYLGVPFEVRDEDGIEVLQRNRMVFAAGNTVRAMYPFESDPVADQVLKFGTVRAYFQTGDDNWDSVRLEKELQNLAVEHGTKEDGTLRVFAIQDGDEAMELAAIDLTEESGETFVDGEGARGNTLGFRLEQSDPDVPWNVTELEPELSFGRDRK